MEKDKILLNVTNLQTVFRTYAGKVKALNDVTFSVGFGEALGIVGESGSGKSVTMLSIMDLLSENGQIVNGEIIFNNKSIRNLKNQEIQALRGNEIGMIFQDPMTSLNPVFTVGTQLIEAVLKHNKITKEEAEAKAIDMLRLVGIPEPEKRLRQYPHQFSGGMRQRAMIAMSLSCTPKLLIADEPTTALDVTIQAQILELMKELMRKINMSIILITHDMGIVADICERVIVMYGGIIVEQGKVDDIFYRPLHPYTTGLLKCMPRLNLGHERLKPIEGQPPDMINLPAGCPFAARCSYTMKICLKQKPPYIETPEGQGIACWMQYKCLVIDKQEQNAVERSM
ncbi:MAG: ABC transporter ATP-binding protein [Clostridiales bacterium]|nr:ABC transporter ATP-binding protein [Clostridiales bacterium]